ncbi:unnamed protein product [Pleuronectes platessa]|uniref:Uncharacterized protein n=1 Tax=Pleuronectes platessa TaxID=8262 RepID=A0A9N7YRT4_PLEPL|nr:unnamed protein product [Pleuronectes platessa]
MLTGLDNFGESVLFQHFLQTAASHTPFPPGGRCTSLGLSLFVGSLSRSSQCELTDGLSVWELKRKPADDSRACGWMTMPQIHVSTDLTGTHVALHRKLWL